MSHLPKLRLRTERNDVASLSTSPDVKGLLQALLRISTATHWPALDGTQPRQPGSAPPHNRINRSWRSHKPGTGVLINNPPKLRSPAKQSSRPSQRQLNRDGFERVDARCPSP